MPDVPESSVVTVKQPINRRRFGDLDAIRQLTFDNVKAAAAGIKPINNSLHTLELADVDYEGPDHYPISKQKEAVLAGRSLTRRLLGTWRLKDNKTGKLLDEQRMTIAHVPYLTQEGTYVVNGTKMALSHQLRLRPGVYTRRKANGELEAHVNVMPGQGFSHHYYLEPETGIFKVKIGQAHLPAVSLLRALGATDPEIRTAWGNDLYAINATQGSAHVLDKLYQRVVRRGSTEPDKSKAVRDAFAAMAIDPEVTRHTLKRPFTNVDKSTVLAITRKLLNVFKGKEEGDDRDHLAYQTIMGPEDILAERVAKDRNTLQQLLWKATYRGNLSHVRPGIFNKAINAALLGSGLGQVPEGINAVEFVDHGSRVTRMGDGGIGSSDAIPDESRNVHPGHLGVLDIVKTPECFDAETEVLTTNKWKKWSETSPNDLFACLVNGQLEWHRPTRLINYFYSGVLCGIQTENAEYLVTPDHRVAIVDNKGEIVFETAENLRGCAFSIPTSLEPPYEVRCSDHFTRQYDGPVYCAKVPGGLLYVRRNGCKGFWSGNSEHIGVDLRAGFGVQKGSDGRFYFPVRDVKSGRIVYRSPQDVARIKLAFPGELSSDRRYVAAMDRGRMRYVPKDEIDAELPSFEQAFSPISNMVPLKSAVKGQRLSMGARMLTQALPLVSPEPPLVRTAVPGQANRSFEELLSRHAGAVFASDNGKVVKVDNDEIVVKYDDGTRTTHELYHHFPGPRKTGVHNTPLVSVGDRVAAGQVLAKSNVTNDKGEISLGRNLRIAYVPVGGKIYEDSAIISESAAKKLTSEHYYQHPVDWDSAIKRGKKSFVSIFPGKYDLETYKKFDDRGIVQKGSIVGPGDPLILIAREKERTYGQVHRGSKSAFSDQSVTWEHHHPGVVTDVVETRGGVNVVVRTVAPTQVGDKISGRHGAKSVIADILPDNQMPHDSEGRPFDMAWSPLGLVSRINPAWAIEAALGKVAAKTGKPYIISDFDRSKNLAQLALDELSKHGLSDTETITDPVTGRKIPGVLTGTNFIMKLHHTSESKAQARGLGAYSAEGAPATGPGGRAKRMSLGDTHALLAYGATNVLQDAHVVRGSKNEEFWMQFMGGFPPPHGKVPFVYRKLMSQLKSAGVNPVREDHRLRLMALTNKDVDTLAEGRELKNAETVRFDRNMEPIKGGLFDPAITGGTGAEQHWSKITLVEPMPNPVFAEPIRRLLGLTEAQYRDVIAGKHLINGQTGPAALANAFDKINVPRELEQVRLAAKSNKKTARDEAFRKLYYLKALDKTGQHPRDWILRAVPVLPPAFRPVSAMRGGGQLIADANYLYKELFDANENLRSLKGSADDLSDERSTLYKTFEAVVGLGEPTHPKNVERRVRGALAEIFGTTAKYSVIQQKLLGTTVDTAGRAVVSPDPNMDMDSVGLPVDKAWDVFRPFVVRRLVRSGVPRVQSLREVEERTPLARQMLEDEMSKRPVLINRYPILHKYGLLAQWPKLVAGDVIKVSPLITKQMVMDFDGNCLVYNTIIQLDFNIAVVYNALGGREFIEALKGAHMRLNGKEVVHLHDGIGLVRIPIGEFPRYGEPTLDRNGAEVYCVPDGIRVYSYDHASRCAGFYPVKHFTVERNQPCCRVSTARSRIVEVSNNESLCVFDRDNGGLKKAEPSKVVGEWVPVVKSQPAFGNDFDYEIGWWYGSLISDGWVSDRVVGYAKNEDAKRNEFVKIARRKICEDFVSHEYAYGGPSKLGGVSKKAHLNSTKIVKAVFDCYVAGDDRGALRKRIPAQLIKSGSKECLTGLLAGLIDGDGSLSWCKSKNRKPRLNCQISTSSGTLAKDVASVCRRLGIRPSITTMPPRGLSNTAYIVTLSAVDVVKVLPSMKFIGANEQRMQSEIAADPSIGNQDNIDAIPITKSLAAAVATALRKFDLDLYGRFRKAISYGSVSRHLAAKALGLLTSEFTHADLAEFAGMVANNDIHWDRYNEVSNIEPQDVFDLDVPDTKVFMIDNGLIVYDTSQFHVPVSDKAVADAIEKMLPSRNLVHPATMRATAFLPQMEFLQGLHAASVAKEDRPVKVFATRQDAIRAHKRGEIGLGQRIHVVKDD